MPKDWTRHKAEITRLYIEEGKTLNEVREILELKHDFKASIRAYRMRTDEWALRKYKSRDDTLDGQCEDDNMNNHIPNTGTEMPPPCARVPRNKVHELDSNVSVPPKSAPAAEVMALIQDPSASSYALEVILAKWQSGGQYLDLLTTLLGTHQYCQYITRCTKEGRLVLFTLIEAFVPTDEQPQVAKLIMEALFSARQTIKKPTVAWFAVWNAACQCSNWENFREALHDGGIVASMAGEIFERATLVVFAERLARRCIKRIQQFRTQMEWPNESEKTQVSVCRQNLIEVLENTKGENLTLGRPVYKYSPEILEREINGAVTQEQKCLDLAEWCRHKYLSMINESPLFKGHFNGVDDARQDVEEREWMNTPRCGTPHSNEKEIAIDISNGHGSIYSTHNGLATGDSIIPSQDHWTMAPTNGVDAYILPEGIQEGRMAVNNLVDKWKSLQGFTSTVHSILARNTNGIFIFDHPSDSSRNLFDLIHNYIDAAEQFSITKAILVACSTINMEHWAPWNLNNLTWWLSLFNATEWPDFQNRICPKAVQIMLEADMSPESMTLISNATVLLVGERFLNDLKATMLAMHFNHGPNMRGDDAMKAKYREMSNQYLSILMEFRLRGLNVDQSWLSYALNTM